MTKREQSLVIFLMVVIAGWLIYRFWPRNEEAVPKAAMNNYRYTLEQADQLLRSRRNIVARQRAVHDELETYRKRFYAAADSENAKIALLKTVEGLAAQANLTVLQKSIAGFHEDTIGVNLEGKTGPESFIRFLQQIGQSPIGLRIQRLQIHSIPESRQLNYQLTVITLLVKK